MVFTGTELSSLSESPPFKCLPVHAFFSGLADLIGPSFASSTEVLLAAVSQLSDVEFHVRLAYEFHRGAKVVVISACVPSMP